jgi:replicative DNA helicase
MNVTRRISKRSEKQQTVDSELAVLSAALLDPSLLDKAYSVRLLKEDFQTPEFGVLYERLILLRMAGEEWQESNTARAIQESGISKATLVTMLEMADVYRLDFRLHVRRVIDASRLLKIANVVEQAAMMVQNREPVKDTVDWIEAELQQIKANRELKIYDCLALGEMSIAAKQVEHKVEAFTGLSPLDDLIGGFHAGDLTVLAARASVGKTAFALQLAEHNANRGRPVLFVSLEMDGVDIFDRLVANDTSISISRLRSGRKSLSDRDLEQISSSVSSFHDLPLSIFAPSKATVSDIRTAARITQARHGLGLVVIDYLTFIKHPNGRMDRREQVSEICKDLKRMAKDLKVPVIVLSQLNRQAEGEVPTLAMLRESGSVEEDADHVIFVHRESRIATDGKIICAKNRHGQCGVIDVDWDGSRMRYAVSTEQGRVAPKTKQWRPAGRGKPEGEPWTG